VDLEKYNVRSGTCSNLFLLIIGKLSPNLFHQNFWLKSKLKPLASSAIIFANDIDEPTFRRKTGIVSRNLLMIDLTVALFASFHGNSALENIGPLICNFCIAFSNF
jgi:hypothetical protein